MSNLVNQIRNQGFDAPKVIKHTNYFTTMLWDFTGQWKGFSHKSENGLLLDALSWIRENKRQINFERKLWIDNYRNEIKYNRNKNYKRAYRKSS